MKCILFAFTLLCCVSYGLANPAIEREFRRVVNSNECLKDCMVPVQQSNLELSIFKRANYSDYFLKLDHICELITTARHCIDNCHITSNPFALISMNSICSEKSRQDAKLLESCFANSGAQVYQQCSQVCGDYEQLNDQLHLSTSTLKPEDQAGVDSVNQQSNTACSTMKCAARCSVDQFNRQCGHLANGEMAGNLIREVVERILSTHRMDLQVFGLLEKMRKETQPECNYLHTAEVLFNPLKDMISQQVLRNNQQVSETTVVPQVSVVPQQPQETQDVEQQMKLTARKLYVAILKKQLRVLDKQIELMNKQEQKLDTEMVVQQPQRLQDVDGMF